MHTRSTPIVAAAAVLGAGLSLLAGAAAATTTSAAPPPPSTAVDVGAGDQTDPHIDGTLVTYTSEENGGSEIRWYDLVTGTRGSVPTTGAFDFLNAVSGDRIAYTRITDRSVIHVLDTGTGVDVAIDDAPGANDRAPDIGGDTVAIQRLSDGLSAATSEIVVHDLATGISTPLTDDSFLDKNPSVSPDGSVVVWTKCTNLATGCDVWRAIRGASGWDVAPVAGPGEESLPATDGEVIVFASARPVGSVVEQDIEVVPLDGRPAFRLDLPSVQRNPNVDDGIVTFESFDDPALNYDLAVWELEVDQVRFLSDTAIDESLNGVSVTADGTVRVVWTTNGGGPSGFDVLATSFPRTPIAPAPSLAATVRQPVDTDGSSTFNAKRGVVPLSFAVTDGGAPTCSLPPATLALTRLGAASVTVDEAVYATSSDQGSMFRVVDCGYRYNLGARPLGPGRYRIDVIVGGQVIGTASFSLA